MNRLVHSYALCRLSIAFVWFYHGLVPKLLGPHADELAMNMSLGLSEPGAVMLARVAGVGEILMAGCVLLFWKQRWPLLLTAVSMLGLLLFVLIFQPPLLLGAFNPVSTNLAVFALSVVALQLLAAQMRES